MRQINLLPNELKPSRKFSIALKRAGKVFMVFLLVYFLVVGASYGFIYYLSSTFKNLQTKKISLSSELKSLTSVETSTVYVRDRIEKFNQLEERNVEKTGLEIIDEIIKNIPANTNISNINISENNLSFSVAASDISGLSKMIEIIENSGKFTDVSLVGLSYDKERKYSFGFETVY